MEPGKKRVRSHASYEEFVVCAPELSYCTDCQDNRKSGSCPRQKKQKTGQKSIGDFGRRTETKE